jgi:hypothetical protein
VVSCLLVFSSMVPKPGCCDTQYELLVHLLVITIVVLAVFVTQRVFVYAVCIAIETVAVCPSMT